jgi:acetyl-CoA C-acetyltransferase
LGTIKDKVAIVGMGCTKFGELWNKGPDDLILEAVYEALGDAGIDSDSIEAAWIGTERTTGPGTPGGALLADCLKLKNIPITRVENACCTGHEALRNACLATASGMYDITLAVGVEKLKDSGTRGLGTGRGRHPLLEARRTAPGTFAFIATRYFHVYGLSPEEGKKTVGKIAVKNHDNGSLCHKAFFQRKIALEEVLGAPIIAWPLGLYDCCPNTDGAVAAVICRKELANQFSSEPIYVKGLGLSVDSVSPLFRIGFDWLGFEATRSAARKAYEQAGIKNPRNEIDVASVHDCFTITEMIVYEDLGFSPQGRAKEDIDSGFFTLKGGLPVNTDGGLISFGHPIGASGLRMTYEIYNQLQGRCGGRQVRGAERGLSHTLGGPPQVSCVAIFGNNLG